MAPDEDLAKSKGKGFDKKIFKWLKNAKKQQTVSSGKTLLPFKSSKLIMFNKLVFLLDFNMFFINYISLDLIPSDLKDYLFAGWICFKVFKV